MKKVHRVLWILIVIASALAAPLMADKVLIYGPTVTGGMSSIEAQTAVSLGFTVDLITTPAAWLALTPADFQSYRAIIVGDPTCTEGTPAVLAPVEANANVWGPLVNGNVIIIGTDPALHSSLGNAAGTAVSQRAVAYAAAQPGKLGAYISLSCYYASAPSGTPVPLLNNAFGPNFLVRSSSGFNSVHMTATSSALVNPLPAPLNTVPPLSDSLLSNWSASTHEIFESWPLNFVVLAIAVTGSSYTAPDGTVGTPYILARGDVSVLSDISLTPASATNDIGTSHTFTASITPPLPGVVVTFKVISGPNAGLTFTALTDASGKASFTYASTAAGTDVIQAQFVNASGKTQTSNLARKQWVQTPKSCLRILQSQILCQLDAKGKPTGNYVWTFRIQNLSGMPVSHLFLANIAPAVATPDHIIFSPALGNNGISTSQQVVLSGVMPGPLTFTMSLHDERLDECCSIPVTLDLPSCDCGQIVREVTPRCFTFPFTSIPPPYRYTFQVQNLAPFAVENLLIAPVDPSDLVTPIPPSQLSVTKDVIPIAAIPQGGTSGPQTLALNGPLAKGGQKVCLRIGLHEKDLDPCCSIVRCFTLPSCFIDFSDVRPIGEARLTFREASFTIDAIGSSGKDGARIAAAGAKSVALAWEPLDSAGPLAPGAYVELRAVSGGDETAGTLRVAKRGDGAYEAVAKIDAAQTYRIEVFNGEQLAGTGTKQNGIVAVGVWPVGATIDVTPPTSQEHHETLAFTLETAAPVAWTLNDGSTLTGDRVRITPEQHEEGDAALQALELVAANIPSITVTKTVVVRDCNGNGVPDAEDIANGTSLDLNGNGAPDECEALTTTSLSTGFDQQSGGLTAAGADDDDWRVVEPGSARAAKVVNNPPAAWRTLAQSRWIAPDANRGASLPGVTTIAYERCFCLAEEADAVTLDLRLRADNEIAEVTLNGQSLNGSGGAFNDLEPLALTRSGRVGDGLFVAGANCLRVTVTDHGIFTGLNVAGSVSATGGACAPNVTP